MLTNRSSLLVAGAVALAVSACAGRPDPYFKRTMLTPLTEIEKTMDCRQVDLAIDRADTVRWLIRDAGGHLETRAQRSARQAGNVIIVPVAVLLATIGVFIPPHLDNPAHDQLMAADGRLHELLQVKLAHKCPPRTTALPGTNDLDLLHKLEAVQSDIDGGRGDEEVLFKERTQLLDGLRVITASGGASEVSNEALEAKGKESTSHPSP